jgi:DNA repair exonuclease SbcCD ATPase subunit
MRRLRVLTAVPAAALVLISLTACADDDTTLSEEAQWANGVCEEYSDLQEAVQAVNDQLPTTDGGLAERVEAAADELKQREAAVSSALDDLRQSLGEDFPIEADPELKAAQQQLSTDVASARTTVDDARASLQQLVDDPSAANVSALRAELNSARTDLEALAQQLRRTGSEASQAVRSAFRAAPECQPYVNPDRPE